MALQAGSPMRAAQATPFRMSHPTHPPPNASPVHRSAVRALAPSSPIASNRLTYIRSFVNFTSAQRWRLHLRRWVAYWTRGGVRLDRKAIREHPAPPDPPYRTFYDRSGHVKGNTRGGRHYHHSEGPTHAGWPRHASCAFCVAAPRREATRKVVEKWFHFWPKNLYQSHGRRYRYSPISHPKLVNVTASFLSAKVTHLIGSELPSSG